MMYNAELTVAKFLERQVDKAPDSLPLILLLGHFNLMAGSFRAALAEYYRAFRVCPDDPFVSLFISLGYLHQVMGRQLANRHYTVVQAFAFLQRYERLRGECQGESTYNMARALHQLRLLHLAVPLYQKVLELSSSPLKRPAAYNLSLIYRETSPMLAASLLRTHLRV